jgi:hypothetical protein
MSSEEQQLPINDVEFDQVSLVAPSPTSNTRYHRTLINGKYTSFSLDKQANTWLFTKGLTGKSTYNKNITTDLDINTPGPDADTVGGPSGRFKMTCFLKPDNPQHMDIIKNLIGEDGASGAIGTVRESLAAWLATNVRTNPAIANYVIANSEEEAKKRGITNGKHLDINEYETMYEYFLTQLVSFITKPTKRGGMYVLNINVAPFTKFFNIATIQNAIANGIPVDWDNGADPTLEAATIDKKNLVHTAFELIPIVRLGNFEFDSVRTTDKYRLNIALELSSAIVRPVVRRQVGGMGLLSRVVEDSITDTTNDDESVTTDNEPVQVTPPVERQSVLNRLR